MAKKFKSLTCKIMDQLKAEGRVSYFTLKHDQQYYDDLREIQMDSRRKQAASWAAARKIILD